MSPRWCACGNSRLNITFTWLWQILEGGWIHWAMSDMSMSDLNWTWQAINCPVSTTDRWRILVINHYMFRFIVSLYGITRKCILGIILFIWWTPWLRFEIGVVWLLFYGYNWLTRSLRHPPPVKRVVPDENPLR